MILMCGQCLNRLIKLKCTLRLTLNIAKINTNFTRSVSLLFYGSDDFSVTTLKLIQQNKVITNLELVTGSDKNLVYRYALDNQLICHKFPYKVPHNCYDIGIVASFGKLIPENAINACRLGMINIHGSLLPRWRGAAPLNYSILNNDTITGITITRIMPKKFDIGSIVMQRQYDIPYRCTAKKLRKQLAIIGGQLLCECLLDLENKLKDAKPQCEDGVTYAPKFDDTYGEIIWSSMTAQQIDARFRAFYGFIDIYSQWIDGTRVKLHGIVDPTLVNTVEMNELSNCDHHKPGFLFYHTKRRVICIAAADNTWTAFNQITQNGRRYFAADFNNCVIKNYNSVILQKVV